VALVATPRRSEPSLGIRLLADIKSVFIPDGAPDVEAHGFQGAAQRLQEIAESPWHDLRASHWNERRLSGFLKQYGVKSKTVRIGDSTPKGYARLDLYVTNL